MTMRIVNMRKKGKAKEPPCQRKQAHGQPRLIRQNIKSPVRMENEPLLRIENFETVIKMHPWNARIVQYWRCIIDEKEHQTNQELCWSNCAVGAESYVQVSQLVAEIRGVGAGNTILGAFRSDCIHLFVSRTKISSPGGNDCTHKGEASSDSTTWFYSTLRRDASSAIERSTSDSGSSCRLPVFSKRDSRSPSSTAASTLDLGTPSSVSDSFAS